MPSSSFGIGREVDFADTHYLASAWRMKLPNGDLGFTNFNQSFTRGGLTYTPVAGFDASSSAWKINLESGERQLTGIVDGTVVTRELISGGSWRDAEVIEEIIDWRWPWAAAASTHRFFVGDMRVDGELWSVSIRSVPSLMEQEVGDAFTSLCPFSLGDRRCGADVSTFTFGVSVTQVEVQRTRFRTTSFSPASTFELGSILWKTGANAGYRQEISQVVASPLTVILSIRTPGLIAVGDTLDVIRGCDQTPSTCKSLFNNFARFGGRPHIPGDEAIRAYPDRR